MRRFRFAILIVLLTIPASAFSGQFKIIKIYDGDTVKAAGHGVEIKVRLAGIDAPETKKGKRKPGQPYSLKAKKEMWSLGEEYISPKKWREVKKFYTDVGKTKKLPKRARHTAGG